ncbi:unnamed protein product [Trichobilharzia szidati]|nr:unnamed protein product [Trichobilharzia szidati]
MHTLISSLSISCTSSSLNTDSNFQLKLSDTVNNLSVPINSTVHLRCQLPIIPKQKDSVYVIWRFRHSHKDPAPNTWSFIHKDDDLARCPEPPYTCEFVNQYVVLNRLNQSLFNNPSEDGAPFSSNDIELIHRRQLFTLKLTNLQPDMNGLFQCHVLVNLDAYDKRGHLNILVPPSDPLHIIRIDENFSTNSNISDYYKNTSEKSFTLISGKLYYFSCLITSVNPKPQISWLIRHSKNGIRKMQTIDELNETKTMWKTFSNYVDIQKSNDLTYEDDKSFLKCIAKNSLGTASSDEVKLNVQYVPVIHPFDSNPLRVLETTSFTQVCRVQANPPARIHWIDEERNIISNNSFLAVYHVSRSGPKHYACVASNEIGENIQKLSIDVLFPPTVHVQPKVTVNEGEALEIACRVDANPSVTSVYWTFNKPIHQGRQSEKPTLYSSHSNQLDGSRLKIPHTRAFHTGEYYCHAETGIYTPNDLRLSQKLLTLKEIWSIWQNRSTLYAPVNLTINYPPGQPTLTMIHSINNKGEDYISLRCQLNISSPGLPSPTFHWIRSYGFDEKQEIISEYSDSDYDEVSKILTIRLYGLSLLDSGIYSCFVQNHLGSSQPASVSVLIKSKPILISKPFGQATLHFHTASLLKNHRNVDHYNEIGNLLQYGVNIVNKRNMSCTFISSLPPDIQWLFHRNQGAFTNYHNIFDNDYSILKQSTRNYIMKNKFGLWRIETWLEFQEVDIILYVKNTLNKVLKRLNIEFTEKLTLYNWNYQVLKQILEFIIILRMEGKYLCETSNSMGIEQGSINLTIQTPPRPFITFNEIISTSADSSKTGNQYTSSSKLYGPLFCQFFGKPAVHTINWWKFTGSNYHEINDNDDNNKWKLIYTTENFNKTIKFKEVHNYLIVTGKPAFIIPSTYDFTSSGKQTDYKDFYYNLEKTNYKFTMFTMLWLKEVKSEDYGYYKCESVSEVGRVSEIRLLKEPNVPQTITELYQIQSTWTSVTISWEQNYHDSQLDLPYQDILNTSNDNNIFTVIQNFLQIWLDKSQSAQKYLIELEDHGTNSNLSETFKPTNKSSLFPNFASMYKSGPRLLYESKAGNTERKTLITHFLVNTRGENLINISGLMSNHLYTVKISGINKHGKGKPSKALAFKTKSLNPEIPGHIQIVESKESIQFSRGNPAFCAQVAVSNDNDNGNTWDTIHFSSNHTPTIIVNGKVFYPETKERYVELVNCKPLSWNDYTEIPVKLQQKLHYRARYCIYGHNTLCTEYVRPVKDISTYIVIISALLCITLVGLLGGLFIYITCRHLNKNGVSSRHSRRQQHQSHPYPLHNQQVNESQYIIIKDNSSNLFS